MHGSVWLCGSTNECDKEEKKNNRKRKMNTNRRGSIVETAARNNYAHTKMLDFWALLAATVCLMWTMNTHKCTQFASNYTWISTINSSWADCSSSQQQQQSFKCLHINWTTSSLHLFILSLYPIICSVLCTGYWVICRIHILIVFWLLFDVCSPFTFSFAASRCTIK